MDNLDELLDKILQDKQLRAECLPELPSFWCDFYFPEDFKTPDDYEEIIDWIDNGGNLIWFWYRGCAKTSKIRKWLCKRIAKKQNNFIRWTSYDVGKAEDNITSISNMLIGDTDSLFVYDYGRLYYDNTPFSPFKQKTQKRTSGFISSNGVIVKANSIRKSTRWLNQFIGKKSVRPDLDILDDIDDDENTENPKTITKNLKKIKGAIFGGSTGQKIILGNTINEDWILPRLAEEYKDNKRWKIVYTKLINDDGSIHRPERFVATDTEAEYKNIGKPVEQRVVSIESLRAEAGRDWFGANYMLIPLRNGVPIIEEQWCKTEQYVPIHHGHRTYLSIDNAESEEDGSDPIGLTVGTWMPEQNKWNIRYSGKLTWRNKDLGKVEEKIKWLYDKYHLDWIIIENKAGGITLRKHLLQKNYGRAIYLFDPGKYSKIWRLRKVQPLMEGGRIVFDIDVDESFIKELIKFPNIEHDDRIDSFTALILYHKWFLMKIEEEEQKKEDWNSIESAQKKDKPKEINTEDRVSALMNKYQKPGSSRFTKDF